MPSYLLCFQAFKACDVAVQKLKKEIMEDTLKTKSKNSPMKSFRDVSFPRTTVETKQCCTKRLRLHHLDFFLFLFLCQFFLFCFCFCFLLHKFDGKGSLFFTMCDLLLQITSAILQSSQVNLFLLKTQSKNFFLRNLIF